jgi:hypothetical protein
MRSYACVSALFLILLKLADLDGERLGVGVSFDEQHPDYAVRRHVDLVSPVIVLEKCARIPHGFALS